MFIDPPLARIRIMASRGMDSIIRARENDETNGIIKLLVEKDSNLIVGATIFGVGGDEIIEMLAVAMQAGIEYGKLQNTVLPHPTVAELIPWIFADLKPLT